MKNLARRSGAAVLVIVVMACDERPAPPQAAPDPQLQAEVARTKGELEEERRKNELLKVYVAEATKTINDVQEQLAKIGPMQGAISTRTRDPELRGSVSAGQRQVLLRQITDMQAQLQQSAQAIAAFKERESGFVEKVTELSETIDRLQTTVEEKTREIDALHKTIASMSVEVERLKSEQRENRAAIAAHEQTIQARDRDVTRLTEELNTAHVAIGSVRDLLSQNIVVQVGRIRRSRRVSPDLDPTSLTPIDIRTTSEFVIAAPANRVEVISTHPVSSYHLESRSGVGSALVVDHAEEFWKFRYLIIGTK
jgi:septal ring factor EnvC (AmiA/AmiB activator)